MKLILPLAAGMLLLSCAVKKNISKTGLSNDPAKSAVAKADSVKKIKPYKDVITSKAITSTGIFKVHKVDQRWFFEIPDSMFGKEFLLVSRISKGSYNGPWTSTAGDELTESLIKLVKGPNDKVFIQQSSYYIRASDTTRNGMQPAIDNGNMQPITVAFDIKTISTDSSGVVIDVTDMLNADNEFLFIPSLRKGSVGFGLGGYMSDKSYIQGIRSFRENIEIITVKTYSRSGAPLIVPPGNVTMEINTSIVLLPSNVMKPRFVDPRVGYAARMYWSFDAAKPVNQEWIAARWRLEPKSEDAEKYKKGILVEPQKPIVFYIDPATPKQWVPFLLQGVNDWQKAFEKAGFKNAIYALEAPVNDTDWSIEDARHNVIVYKAALTKYLRGNMVIDPRSGEILESHIQWDHNVQETLQALYFVQGSPNDPGARRILFDDALMGSLIRQACAREVGRALGLIDNFGASSTVPVDSLRSKIYVRANGFCPSIMDNVRVNYVAQPEDEMERVDLLSRVGVYDEWAIEWGYRWLPDIGAKQERQYLNTWVTMSREKDKRLVFGQETSPRVNNDPARQGEDLGDNVVKASRYGIANLKRIMPHLVEWARLPNEDYGSLRKMNNAVYQQYVKYLEQAIVNLGGELETVRMVEEKNPGIRYTSKEVQKQAVQFLIDELFTRPSWLMDRQVYLLSADEGSIGKTDYLMLFHTLAETMLNDIFSHKKITRLRTIQSLEQDKAYSVEEFLGDLENGIWKELSNHAPIDMYRRNLQKVYAERFAMLIDVKQVKSTDDSYIFITVNTDVYPMLKRRMKALIAKVSQALPFYKDPITREHLIEIKDRLEYALDKESGFLRGTGK